HHPGPVRRPAASGAAHDIGNRAICREEMAPSMVQARRLFSKSKAGAWAAAKPVWGVGQLSRVQGWLSDAVGQLVSRLGQLSDTKKWHKLRSGQLPRLTGQLSQGVG